MPACRVEQAGGGAGLTGGFAAVGGFGVVGGGNTLLAVDTVRNPGCT
jgi:hypothetical protein